MSLAVLYVIGLVVAPLCAAGTLLVRRGRWVAGMLMGVFIGAGLMEAATLQLRIGLGLMLTGIACSAILLRGFLRSHWSPVEGSGKGIPQGIGFRAAVVLLVGFAAWGLSARDPGFGLPVSQATWTSAFIVFSIGFLQLGLSRDAGAAGVGLLVSMVGFEAVYARLEPSLAMRAVLASIMIGIATVVSLALETGGVRPPAERRES
jgi:hypothetical protein